MASVRPSELEMQVLSVLWEQGPSTVRQILDALPDGKERAYTTVLTVMQGMERKKLVSHTRDGLAHVYQPAVKQDEIMRPVMQTMLQNIFGGDPSRAVQALLQSTSISPDELKRIRRVVNDAARLAREGNDE